MSAPAQEAQEPLAGLAFAVHDFDKTTHQTDELPEGGHNVESACEIAVETVLGDEALAYYQVSGGLQNRAPSAIIESLARPTASAEERQQLTEDFISVKLGVLTRQIGTRLPDGDFWPRLTPGFREHWQWLNQQAGITTGQLSSGHGVFIRKAFETHDLPAPQVLVSDDDMRPLMASGLTRQMCEKPSALPLDMSCATWLLRLGLIDEINSESLMRKAKSRIVMAGDSLKDDGGCAQNAEVAFVHIRPGYSKTAFNTMRAQLRAIKAERAVARA